MRIAFALTALALTACRPDVTGLDAVAVSASLDDTEAITLIIIGGATWGEANMTFTDDTGVARQVPVAFAGPSGGLLMDVHVAEQDLLWDGSTTAELAIPEGGVPVDDLFGLYDGGGGAIGLGLGYCGLEIDNDAAVRLLISGACAGLSMARSENWLTLSADGDVTAL